MSEDNGRLLPAGWTSATLQEIANVNPRLDGRVFDDDFIVSFVPMAAVDPEHGGVNRPETRPYGRVKKGYTPFLPGDVIVAKITPCMENGKVAVVPDLIGGVGFGSTEFHVIRPPKGIDPRWISHFLWQSSVRHAAWRAMTGGVGQLRVPKEFLKTLTIPIAGTTEQERILDKAEELFSDLDAGVAALERVRRNLKRYRASVLKAAVEGRLTKAWRAEHPDVEPARKLLNRILKERRRRWEADRLAAFKAKGKTPPQDWKGKYKEPAPPNTTTLPDLPEGWCWATVEQLTSGDRTCAYGVLQPGPHVDAGIPILRVGDINHGRISLAGMKRVKPSVLDRYSRTTLRGDEVVMSLVGAIGRTAVVPKELAGANTARAVGVIPLTGLVSPRWVEVWFRNPQKVAEMTQKSHEVARKTLNLEDVRSATVALPPIEEQELIVDEAEEHMSNAYTISSLVVSALTRAGRLRQCILKRAFEGRLVPQDSNDEAASVLLDRIRANLAASCVRPRRTTVRPRRKSRSNSRG